MASYKGLDISSWQEGLNLKSWKDALGLSFVIIKVGGNEGGRYRDKCFDGFYKQAKACGLHVGAYYYTTSTTTSAARGDADHMLELLKGYDLDMPCYMDVEDGRQFALGARALTDVIKAFCDRINAGGRYAGLYTGGSAWLNSMYRSELLDYANWIAWWADFDGIEDVRNRCGDIGMWQVGGISIGGHVAYGDVSGHLDYDICCKEYWNTIKGTTSNDSKPTPAAPTEANPKQKVLDLIRGEVGTTAYNGKHNKYAKFLDSLGDVYNYPKDGYDWCDIFADYPFFKLFGKSAAVKMLNQPLGGCGAGCPYSADYFAAAGRFDHDPEVCAHIYFGTRGDEYHVGLVEGYDNNNVYTIEGNTGYSEGYSGGAVLRRTYRLNDSRIAGYGHPDWSVVGGTDGDGSGGGSYTPSPRNNRDGGKLDVDGIGGYNTTIDLQHVMGTVEDGEISGQWRGNQPYHWAMDSIAYGSGGSDVVEAIQRMVGADDDRQWGPQTSRLLQEFLIRKGYSVGPSGADSYFGHDSVCGLQQWLNDGAPR